MRATSLAWGDSSPTKALVAASVILVTLVAGYGIAIDRAGVVLAAFATMAAVGLGLVRPAWNLVVAWLVAVPFLRFYVNIPLPAGVPDVDAARAMTILVATILMLKGTLGQIGPISAIRGVRGWLVIFVLLRTLSVAWSPVGTSQALYTLLGGVWIPFFLYVVTLSVVTDNRQVDRVLGALAILVMVAAPFGIIESLLGLEQTIFTYLGGAEYAVWNEASGRRAGGPFINPASFGAVMGLGLILALARLGSGRRGNERALALLLISLVAVIMSLTRGAWIATAMGYLAFLLLARRGVLSVVGTVAVLVVGSAGVMVVDHNVGAVSERFNTQSTVYTRLALVDRGLRMVASEPIIGMGLGGFDHEHAKWGPTFRSSDRLRSHNTYLSAAVDSGVPAVAALVFFLVGLFRDAWRASGRGSKLDRLRIASLAGGVVIFAVSALFLDLVYIAFDGTLWFVLAALLERSMDALPDEGNVTDPHVSREKAALNAG